MEKNTILVKPPLRGLGWIIHVATWGILLCMPFLFAGSNSQNLTFINYIRGTIVPVSCMILFYVNYFYLIKQFLFKKEWGRFILCNILVISLLILINHGLMHILPPPDRPFRPEPGWADRIRFFIGQLIFYTLIASLSVAIKMTSNWYLAESARRELEKSHSEAELQNLKSQLNPHFLFNTLNNIYSLIAFSPEKAQEAVHDLSRLLRYVLYESSYPLVPLGKEIDFIKNYVELMRIRLPEHVKLTINISPEVNSEIKVAPLLFISLIENAFKHGVSNNKPSFIEINITQQEGELDCTIHNSYFPKDTDQDKSGSGIGLQNLHKRLELLYPAKYSFTTGLHPEGYISHLAIQL